MNAVLVENKILSRTLKLPGHNQHLGWYEVEPCMGLISCPCSHLISNYTTTPASFVFSPSWPRGSQVQCTLVVCIINTLLSIATKLNNIKERSYSCLMFFSFSFFCLCFVVHTIFVFSQIQYDWTLENNVLCSDLLWKVRMDSTVFWSTADSPLFHFFAIFFQVCIRSLVTDTLHQPWKKLLTWLWNKSVNKYCGMTRFCGEVKARGFSYWFNCVCELAFSGFLFFLQNHPL